MIVLFIALGLVFLFWLVTVLIQKSHKKSRDKLVEKHKEEKKKQEEAESRSPFRN